MAAKKPIILVIGGFDSSGYSGITADSYTIEKLGGLALSVSTAHTLQDNSKVKAIFPEPAGFVKKHIANILDKNTVAAVKIGMVQNASIIQAIAESLFPYAGSIPIILDPVMLSSSGYALLNQNAEPTLKRSLFPLSYLITPNLPETETLVGKKDDLQEAGEALLALGPKHVLIKGGHGEGEEITDTLFSEGHVKRFSDSRIESNNTRGTGCKLASAIACYLGHGLELEEAIIKARLYLRDVLSAKARTTPLKV